MRPITTWSVLLLAAGILVGAAGVSQARAEEAATGSISGKVVDKDGNAVEGATVMIFAPGAAANKAKEKPAAVEGKEGKRAEGDRPGKKAEGQRDGQKIGGEKGAKDAPAQPNLVAKVTTAADGTFTADNIPAGKVRVRAGKEGVGQGMSAGVVEVVAGQETKLETPITLAPRAKPEGEGKAKDGAEAAPRKNKR